MCNGCSIRLTVGFSSEIMEARRQCHDIFITRGKEKKCQPRILYAAKVPLKVEENIKHSHIKSENQLFVSRPALQEMLMILL